MSAESSNAPVAAPSTQSATTDAPKPGKGILGSVDGAGNKPVFGQKEIEARKTGAPAEKQPAKEVPSTGKPVVQKQHAEPKSPADESGLAMLEEQFRAAPKQSESKESDPEDLNADEFKSLGERAQKRITGLTERLTGVLSENQNIKQNFEQMQEKVGNAFQQMQRNMHQLQQQNARLYGQLETLTKTGRVNPGQEPEEQDPVMALREKMGVGGLVDERLKPLMDKLNAYEAREKQAHQKAQISQAQKQINFDVDRATSEVLMAGFSPEVQERIGRKMGTLTLAYAYGRGMVNNQKAAATELRQLIGEAAIELIKSTSAASKAKREASQQIEPSGESGRSNPAARGNPVPTLEDAKKTGAKNPLAAMFQRDGLIRGR
jgi:hypothetical protein